MIEVTTLSYQQYRGINTGLRVDLRIGHEHTRRALCWSRYCSPLRVRFGWGVETETPGDGGILDAEPEGASPLMISWIEASSASTRCDICTMRSTICEDISSNFVSSCSSNVSTKAVSSCGLEMSAGLASGFGGPGEPPRDATGVREP